MREIQDVLSTTEDDVVFDEEGDGEDDDGYRADVLCLPSDFSREERETYALTTHAQFELEYRIGMAFDLLDSVRSAVQHRKALIDSKRINARGQKQHTAANAVIQDSTSLAAVLAERYNANLNRIRALHPAGYDASADTSPGVRLRPIDVRTDLRVPGITSREQGDSQVSGSWIWSVFDPKADATVGDTGTNLRELVTDLS